MSVTRGLIAGAAGTVTLNALTYLDMAARGRGTSSVPAETVAQAADATGARVADDEQAAQSRQQGLGGLLGYATGLGFGAAYGAVRSRRPMSVPAGGLALMLTAMAGANVPPIALGVTDPRGWGTKGWLADILPHLAYGFVTAAVYDTISDDR